MFGLRRLRVGWKAQTQRQASCASHSVASCHEI
jgi:hypothetical protein